MSLTPWYKVVTPRQDLREGRPLDASEFAVHLDHVRQGRAPGDYQDPARFFERTYLTQNLLDLATQAARRLNGIKVETSAVFNLSTAFGGGKTHALTLLYHLAHGGPLAAKWRGVPEILKRAEVPGVPEAAVAVFVGQQFDPRGGDDGTPLRRTPWGEIAFQLGGAEAFQHVADLDQRGEAPGGDIIGRFLPAERPALILLDELMNYISRTRRAGMSDQLYNFINNLCEAARALDHVVVAVALPASELEMGAEDEADYTRFKKMLDRLGKAMFLSAEAETAEIIRRRLFEWVGIPAEGRRVAAEYADWLRAHRQQLPKWFPVDRAAEAFEATYPFHPLAIQVFERKWQALPRFQRTRGVLRMLALWVSRAYQEGYKGAHQDPLIGLGTAPLDYPLFRAAVFEQLGSQELEAAVTTDIAGRPDAHAVRLDEEAAPAVRAARLHRQVATVVFFESNGGVVQARAEATLPEIRLDVATPDLDIGHVETVLDALVDNCYFLETKGTNYHFRLTPGLNQVLSDRLGNIKPARVRERVRTEIQRLFRVGPAVERVYFPEKSADIADQPALTLVVLPPERPAGDPGTAPFVDQLTREHGTSGRTFKSALLWVVPESGIGLNDRARKLLAWEDIASEQENLGLDAAQRRQVQAALEKAAQELQGAVWQAYKKVLLLGRKNEWRELDLGQLVPDPAGIAALILGRLRKLDEVADSVSAVVLLRHWPATVVVWSTQAVRDAFFAAPQLPRLLDAGTLRQTIADGVTQGLLAYVGPKGTDGKYQPFYFGQPLSPADVVFSEDLFVVTADEARKQVEPPRLSRLVVSPARVELPPGEQQPLRVEGLDQYNHPYPLAEVAWRAPAGCAVDAAGTVTAGTQAGRYTVTAESGGLAATTEVQVVGVVVEHKAGRLAWSGAVPPQKWSNLYMRVLASFANNPKLKLTVEFEVTDVSRQKANETRAALKELGLDEGNFEYQED